MDAKLTTKTMVLALVGVLAAAAVVYQEDLLGMAQAVVAKVGGLGATRKGGDPKTTKKKKKKKATTKKKWSSKKTGAGPTSHSKGPVRSWHKIKKKVGGGGANLLGGYGLGEFGASSTESTVAPTLFPSVHRHKKFVEDRPELKAGGFSVRSNYPKLSRRMASGQTDRESISDRTGLAKRIGMVDDPRNDWKQFWEARKKQVCKDKRCGGLLFNVGSDLLTQMNDC